MQHVVTGLGPDGRSTVLERHDLSAHRPATRSWWSGSGRRTRLPPRVPQSLDTQGEPADIGCRRSGALAHREVATERGRGTCIAATRSTTTACSAAWSPSCSKTARWICTPATRCVIPGGAPRLAFGPGRRGVVGDRAGTCGRRITHLTFARFGRKLHLRSTVTDGPAPDLGTPSNEGTSHAGCHLPGAEGRVPRVSVGGDARPFPSDLDARQYESLRDPPARLPLSALLIDRVAVAIRVPSGPTAVSPSSSSATSGVHALDHGRSRDIAHMLQHRLAS